MRTKEEQCSKTGLPCTPGRDGSEHARTRLRLQPVQIARQRLEFRLRERARKAFQIRRSEPEEPVACLGRQRCEARDRDGVVERQQGVEGFACEAFGRRTLVDLVFQHLRQLIAGQRRPAERGIDGARIARDRHGGLGQEAHGFIQRAVAEPLQDARLPI
jgi:hypothetical protein